MKFPAWIIQGLPGFLSQCHLAQPGLSQRYPAPATLAPCPSKHTWLVPAGRSLHLQSLTLTHSQHLTHTHSHSHAHPHLQCPQIHPIHTVPSQLPPQPPCSPITCSLPALSLALDSLLCIRLVNHRLPRTLSSLVSAHFFSPRICSWKELLCVKYRPHRIRCFSKYLLKEVTSLIWKHCQEILLYSLLGL